MLIGDKSLI